MYSFQNHLSVTLELKISQKRRQALCKKLPILAFVAHHTADSMGLSSLKFLYWDPKDASFLQSNAYRPSKVIQGR